MEVLALQFGQAQAHGFQVFRLLGQLRLEAILPVVQLPSGQSQLAGDLGQRTAAGVEQLNGLFLELQIVARSFRFIGGGHVAFFFLSSVSPAPVHPTGGSSGSNNFQVVCGGINLLNAAMAVAYFRNKVA